MKSLSILISLASLLLVGCYQAVVAPETSVYMNAFEEMQKVPEVYVEKSQLEYRFHTSMWYKDTLPYSGYVLTHYTDGSLKEKFSVLEGLRHHSFIEWYEDGHMKSIINYKEGRLHGEKKLWSEVLPHILITHFHFKEGKAHGEQRTWYESGELFKKLNMNMGREEGLQQAYRKNGVIYANYEAREGRIFGLKKAALCFEVEDEKLKI